MYRARERVSTLIKDWFNKIGLLEVDYMEYSSDALAQAAYVTNGFAESVDQQQTGNESIQLVNGNISINDYLQAQAFKLSATLTVTAVEMGLKDIPESAPVGNWTYRIETDSSNKPSGTLANANATVTVTPPTIGNVAKGTFATPFQLTGGVTYWFVLSTPTQSHTGNHYWVPMGTDSNVYANGDISRSTNGVWTTSSARDMYFKIYVNLANLQSYSENTIKTQGSYSLKGIALITTSLNKTLTKTFSPNINLSGIKIIKVDIRASRTGSNIKIGLHDTGGVTTELTPSILAANTFQTVIFDLSAVSDANKNPIDTMIITIVEATAANTFYFDNMYALVLG